MREASRTASWSRSPMPCSSNEAERDHLAHLARTANAERPPRRTAAPQKVRPSIARIVDSMTGVAATVRNARLDTLYANELGRALFSDQFADPRGPNGARFTFFDPALAPVLAGLGARRERHRRDAPRRGGTEPVRPRPVRPHRGAVDPQRGLPVALGGPRREEPPERHQDADPSARRRADAHVRGARAAGRSRPRAADLRRGAGHGVRGALRGARTLGGDAVEARGRGGGAGRRGRSARTVER